MPDAQDDDGIVFDPIAQHIRPHRGHLASPASHVTPAMREVGQAFRDRYQPIAQTYRRGRIERRDVGGDRLEMLDRVVGPDDAAQVSRRRGGAAAAYPYPRMRSSASRQHGR